MKRITLIILFFIPLFAFAQLKKEIITHAFDTKYAKAFSSLIVQSKDGRMKPLDSLNLDILNKIASQNRFYGLNHNQVILGMIYQSHLWKQVPMFKLDHPNLQHLLYTQKTKVSYYTLVNKNDEYKLKSQTQLAMQKEQKTQSSFQKALIKLYEKVQIARYIYNQGFLKIYPLKESINNQWYSPLSLKNVHGSQSKISAQMHYVKNKIAVMEALENQTWDKALHSLKNISQFQYLHGKNIIPSKFKQKAELFYNQILLFEKLYVVYLIIGFIFFIVSFTMVLKCLPCMKRLHTMLQNIILISFILHGFNLMLRWYISSHAPWSDAYESMVFIAFMILLASFSFYKKSVFAVPLSTLCAGFLLFAAHLNFIDPQITNLAPNLQSFWLTIHVAIISASYGFLALSALLGLLGLSFYLFSPKKFPQLKEHISQTTYLNQKSMQLGWFLLIIGTILGSVWANESWGRIWGWDPKETWSLISILIYAVLLHSKLIQKPFHFYFNTLSLLAYSTIIMTYFGVNYFFDAIHVYASNAASNVPSVLYYAFILIVLLISISYLHYKRYQKAFHD